MKKIKSWNNYPHTQHNSVIEYDKNIDLSSIKGGSLLVHALGRSYGDVCLNENGNLILTKKLKEIIDFDTKAGTIKCEAGLSIKEVLNFIVPFGWFLPVVPGTRNVTIGGAIANDIHGKNHHNSGSFGNYVRNIKLLRSNDDLLHCSDSENSDYFKATIGGLGLTGMILEAEIKLKKINSSYIETETQRYDSIDSFWSINKNYELKNEYTVSWVDCRTNNKGLRGVYHSGNHDKSNDDKITFGDKSLPFPFTPPFSLINNLSMRLVNEAYYRINKPISKKKQHYKPFFFPLDLIDNWGRAYGKNGFLQYQFVVPNEYSVIALKETLNEIKSYGQIPALGVMKTFGNIKSKGLLSFPTEGLTLALDFRNKGNTTFNFLNKLDNVVYKYDGSIYPAKDARMSKNSFNRSFKNIDEFSKYIDPRFSSSFWRRVN